MGLEALSAIGACATFAKVLYDYYQVYRNNKRLLDVLRGFTQNLDTAREEQLTSRPSASLASIEKDFRNAIVWLEKNHVNLRTKWTAYDAAESIKDLDERLMKAFSSKMAVALYESVQENRAATQAVSVQIDRLGIDLQASISSMVRESSSASLREAIRLLKEEEYASRPSTTGQGFSTGEVEKIINQLIDQMASAEIRQNDLETRYGGQVPSAGPSRNSSYSSQRPPSSASVSSFGSNSFSINSTTATSTADSKGKQPAVAMPADAVGFVARDPTNDMDLVDPVLCSDGLIHDRTTLIINPDQRDPKTGKRVQIIGGVDQLRDAIHHIFPYRAREYQKRREGYRRDCSALCGPAGHGKLAEQITHLSHVLLWDPGNVDLLIRRGIAYYRVRHLQAAIDDLDTAVELSNAAGLVDLDALRYRALVYEKCHRTGKALADVDAVVSRSKERADPLAYACRSMLRSAMGDHGAAKQDLALAQKWGKQSLGSFGCYTSAINSDNLDLVHLALGWAASSLHRFVDASQHFQDALQLRSQLDPYTLASRGLADLQTNASDAFLALDEAVTAATAHPPLPDSDAHLFELFFLRGMAFYSRGDHAKALADFEQGVADRPPEVRDTGDFRFVLGCCRAEVGDMAAAAIDFDFACALKPVERAMYIAQREHYGV